MGILDYFKKNNDEGLDEGLGLEELNKQNDPLNEKDYMNSENKTVSMSHNPLEKHSDSTGEDFGERSNNFENTTFEERNKAINPNGSEENITTNNKTEELILAKLDAIKSEVSNINHRIENLERQQKEQKEKKKLW